MKLLKDLFSGDLFGEKESKYSSEDAAYAGSAVTIGSEGVEDTEGRELAHCAARTCRL